MHTFVNFIRRQNTTQASSNVQYNIMLRQYNLHKKWTHETYTKPLQLDKRKKGGQCYHWHKCIKYDENCQELSIKMP